MRRIVVVATLALLALSCSSDDDDASTESGAPTDTVSVEDEVEDVERGDAVEVGLELESQTATSATVGPAGATLGATAVDGTAYALLIPPGALAETVDIVMTPLSGLTGMPADTELAFGVSLEPGGLVFGRSAWLYVDSDVEPDDVTGLAIDDDDRASLRGIGFDGERFVLPVAHFSGSGACFPRCGGGWPGFPPNPPGGPGAPGGPGGPGGPPTPPGPGVPPYSPPGTPPGPFPGDEGGDTSGGGQTNPGSLTDGAVGDGSGQASSTDAAVADALGDLADAQLNGDEEAEAAANDKLDEAKARVKDEAWKATEACVAEKDITKLKDILHWVTLGQLLGAAADDAEEESLTSLIGVCMRFELDVIADLTARLGGDVFVIGDSIELTVPLLFDGVGLEGTATGTVDPTGYDRGAELLELLAQGLGPVVGVDVPNDVSQNDYIHCTTTPGTGALHAVAANLFADAGPSVNVLPSIASEASVSCPEPINTFPIPPFVVDLAGYVESGFPGVSESGIRFDDWTVTGSGSPFATTSVHHRVAEDGFEVVMAWDLTLRHAPGPMPTRSR